YFQTPVGLRSGGGVTGAPGPGGLANAPSQQVITGGGPPTQLGQPGGPVPMGIVQGPVGVTGLPTGDSSTGQSSSVTTGKQTRRKHALDIVDPKTMKNVDVYEESTTSSSTPPRSGESSARDTPQPNTGSGAMDVIAEFAARVAAVASEKPTNPPPPPPPSTVTPTYVEPSQTTNGPDPSGTNSIPTLEGDVPSLSKQQIIVVEENTTAMAPATISPVAGTPTTWKPGPLTSSLGSKPSGNSSKSDISNQAVADEKVIEAEPQPTEFVMSVSASDTKLTPTKDLEITPVVSAQINAPSVDVVRNNREQFPALKTSVPSAHQSPRRKQQTQMPRPETVSNVPQSTSVAQSPSVQPVLPSVSRESTPIADVKISKKPTLTEESTPPSSTFPVSQPPKEKRDQEKPHGRDREKSSSISSQGRGEREKSVSSTSSSSSTGRDREKSSREKDKGKDRDKSASQGRDRDKSSTKEAIPVPVQPQVEQPSPPEETKQQANGEMTAPETTDSKASQRSKQKLRNKNMRELNRKGAEKEGGTDMDAFVESTAGEVTPALPTPTQVPTNVVVSTNKVTDNQIVKDEDIETDKEEKLVAARNEENAKVSAAALKEDATSSATPVIENIPTTKPTTLILRHTYSEDQWSPVNPDGKKKYGRDFLMELQKDPQSQRKPNLMIDLDIFLKDNTNRRLADRPFSNMNRPISERSAHENFTPSFMRTPNQRGQATVTKRNSQQGKPKGKQMGIHISLSLKEEVKLHEAENAWKPTRMKSNANNEQEAKTEELYKKVRGVLNKLTPQKFTTLVSQVQSLPIDNSERLQGVINLVFEKAVDEPSFSVAYAGMCKILSGMQVPGEQQENVNFRKLLVNRCQLEFEKSPDLELNKEAKMREIEECTDPDKRKELQLLMEDEERRMRMKSVGNVRFIGELFKLGMLTTNIMIRCIKQLLSTGYEESLECLCKLLTTIGKDLENKNQDLSPYFDKMREVSLKRGEVSSRVRFMLQDVIDLRQNKWIPRRDDSNPKTMDQIQKDAEKEVLETQMILNSVPQTPRRQDDRAPLNRKSRGGMMGEDGWNTVSTSRGANRYTVDASKFKATKDDGGVSLGGSHMFSSWSMGANAKSKDSNKKPLAGGGGGSSYNIYTALDTANEDGKRPAPSMGRPGPGKTTPSPSMEKERMLQPFRSAAEGDNRKGRGASRSSSRDNSARGGGGNEDSASLRPYAPTSQPPSMSASTEDISGTNTNSSSKTLVAPAPTTMSMEEIRKKTSNLLGEFLCNSNFKESEVLVQETFSQDIHSVFVHESLNEMLEKNSTPRGNVGLLMSHLVKSNTISVSSYVAGLNEFLEDADDIAIDVPKIWTYTAELVVPMLLSEALSFSDFRDVAHQPHGELISAVLDLLVKDKGPGWIREKWDAAGLKWTDFIPADQVDDFVKKNKLEYVLGGATFAPSSIDICWAEVQRKLEQFLKSEQDSSTSFDQICEWISANVGDKVKEPEFIRALMTAICRSAIGSQKSMWKLNDTHFLQQQKLVMKYVDNKEELELQCLYAVQSLIHELEHPQGLLCQIFQLLWEDGLITPDSFLAWQDSSDPHEQAGKGVALKSLTTFFTALREGDDDSSCDES
ncbi:hypothetical protein C0J52_06437, partial [Blattella germanica]